MIEQDTIKLLRECDAGVKMGVSSIEGALDYVKDDTLWKYLSDCKEEHEEYVSDNAREIRAHFSFINS